MRSLAPDTPRAMNSKYEEVDVQEVEGKPEGNPAIPSLEGEEEFKGNPIR